jgi:tetratricopeptide (TPR) repeat protein
MKAPGPFRLILSMIVALVFLSWAMAQDSGKGGGSTGGGADKGGSSGPVRPDAGRPPVFMPQQDSRVPEQPVPEIIFISGAVILEDGTPPAFGAFIEMDCGGTLTKEATVDLNGRFGFQVGDRNRFSRLFPDASQGIEQDPFDQEQSMGGFGDPGFPRGRQSTPLSSRLIGCELRAKLTGYRSTVARLNSGLFTGQNEIGNIVVYPIERVKGTAVSLTSLLAPKSAKKLMERAQKAFQKKKYAESESLLRAATAAYPRYVEAWFALGQLLQQQQQNDAARRAYAKAVDADKLYVSPYIRLAQLSLTEGNWQEAADLTDQALALDPITFPEGYYFNALAYYNLSKFDLAEKSARQEQRLDSKHQFPQIHLILANILARRQDTAGSIKEMQNYLNVAPNASDAGYVRSRMQEKEKLSKASADK